MDLLKVTSKRLRTSIDLEINYYSKLLELVNRRFNEFYNKKIEKSLQEESRLDEKAQSNLLTIFFYLVVKRFHDNWEPNYYFDIPNSKLDLYHGISAYANLITIKDYKGRIKFLAKSVYNKSTLKEWTAHINKSYFLIEDSAQNLIAEIFIIAEILLEILRKDKILAIEQKTGEAIKALRELNQKYQEEITILKLSKYHSKINEKGPERNINNDNQTKPGRKSRFNLKHELISRIESLPKEERTSVNKILLGIGYRGGATSMKSLIINKGWDTILEDYVIKE